MTKHATNPLIFPMVDIMISTVEPKRAKLFMTGRSQAVRLPKEFRFKGDTVLVRREGLAVILEPDDWPEGWIESFAGISDLTRPDQGELEKREKLE
ncbi:MAG: AbrB/MazE/SpoVT family DNA-binding protein [Myxococcales bacterium]|nr:AbrB/MazE/SpoVT family DNA-binding protein [Myxococcales bacterium]